MSVIDSDESQICLDIESLNSQDSTQLAQNITVERLQMINTNASVKIEENSTKTQKPANYHLKDQFINQNCEIYPFDHFMEIEDQNLRRKHVNCKVVKNMNLIENGIENNKITEIIQQQSILSRSHSIDEDIKRIKVPKTNHINLSYKNLQKTQILEVKEELQQIGQIS